MPASITPRTVFVCLQTGVRRALRLAAVTACLLAPSLTSGVAAAATLEQTSAALSGRILDGSGAAIPGASITLASPALGVRRDTTSGRTGEFAFRDLPPGTYTMTVQAPSFQTVAREVVLTPSAPVSQSVTLEILPVEGTVTVRADQLDAVRAEANDHYNRNKSVTSVSGATVVQNSPVANYDSLRLLPGVMSAGGGKDRFSVPSHIRGAGAWGTVEQIDDYPAINITPVSAEDGGYTASFSSIIPSLALNQLTLATGGLGVSYGQASGGIVRSGIKRGLAQGPHTTLRVDGMAVGDAVVMGETGGVYRNLDVYVAGQTVFGEYGDTFATYARPMEGLRLVSGLAKAGYKVSSNSRAEALVIAGDESHDYYQLSVDSATPRTSRRDFHTEKSNYFFAGRYDVRPSSNLVFGAGVTHNRFHENRIEDTLDGVAVDLSRRNRPQRATRAFANVDWRGSLSDRVEYSASGGVDATWDRYSDITTTPVAFEFQEQSAFWRSSLMIASALTVNGGLRLASVDNGFETTRPVLFDIGASYALPTNTIVRGSASTGYKLNKAFYLWWGNGLFISRPGSEGLRPSRTETYELGLEQRIGRGSRSLGLVRVSAYRTDETDLFNFGNTGNGVPFYDDQRLRGVELWTEWTLARVRPFASFTWLRTERTGSSNPAAPNVDLRFTPLPNYAASLGAHADLSSRLSLSMMGSYDDGGVNEQAVNDAITVTRFESFFKANATAAFRWTDRLTLQLRVENVFNQRDLGYSRSVLNPDSTSQQVAGTQRDPGTIIGGGIQVRF